MLNGKSGDVIKKKMFDNKSKSSSSSSEEDDDPISNVIGEYGRWQLLLTFLLSLFNIPCTWHIFAPTFHAAARDMWCTRPPHLASVDPAQWLNYSSPPGDPCRILNLNWDNVTLADIQGRKAPPTDVGFIDCLSWEFAGEGTTILSEWDLVCSRKQLNNMAETAFLAGVAMGGLVSGIISDRYGRKRTLMISLLLQTLIGVAISFVPSFELYLALRAALGFISVSVVFSGFVLSLEIVGGSWRIVAGVSYLFPVSISYIMISGMAYMIREWRYLQLAVSLPGAFLLSFWWVLPESPRWLLAMGRRTEVLAILKTAAKANGRELPASLLYKELKDASGVHEDGGAPQTAAGVLDLFRTVRMRKNTLCLFAIWFSVYLVYYGLVLNVGNIGGDLYVTSILSGIVEIPALVMSIIILLRMGRRWPLCLTLVIAGVSCLLTLLIPESSSAELQWLITTLAMIGKLSISSSNAIMPVFTAELYPTVIRNLGVGASNVSAGIALMLVPFLWDLSSLHKSVPMSLIGACGLIGGTCVLFLPETGNKALVGTLEEVDDEVSETPEHSLSNKERRKSSSVTTCLD